ncbi:Adenylate cyclase [Minicystis rosea]|nr:Adenylate cyclase [Minicystis rosea]
MLIAGKYRLERPLATGGMGSVWVARHAQLDTQLAIKFMDPQSTSSAVARARFEREAKASAALRNRHVVNVVDYGVEGDQPYLAMELLYGEDLSRRLHRERRLSLEAAARILAQTAKGLRNAHESHFIHRDLKPANLYLAREDDGDEEIVKILDFGIAKDTAGPTIGEATRTGELMGSPHYMSPEQVRGARDIDHRSDLWSLSVIMFRALTGRMPFNGDNVGVVIAQILADPIPVATRIAPDLPPALDAFFTRGFARDREQRFQSAREMAEALAALAAGSRADAGMPIERAAPASQYPLETVNGTVAPSARIESLSAPTESVPMLTDAPTPPPASSAFGGTGGPVIHTAPPPPAPSLIRWLPLAGAAVGVLIGAVAFLVVRPHDGAAPAAGASASAPPEASGSASAPATASAHAVEPAPSATATAEPEPSATAAVSTPTAAPSNKPATKPKDNAPPSRPPAKKKPNWGF